MTDGKLSLTNAAEANKAIGAGKIQDKKQIEEIVTVASTESGHPD